MPTCRVLGRSTCSDSISRWHQSLLHVGWERWRGLYTRHPWQISLLFEDGLKFSLLLGSMSEAFKWRRLRKVKTDHQGLYRSLYFIDLTCPECKGQYCYGLSLYLTGLQLFVRLRDWNLCEWSNEFVHLPWQSYRNLHLRAINHSTAHTTQFDSKTYV